METIDENKIYHVVQESRKLVIAGFIIKFYFLTKKSRAPFHK
jgi:hypothetical protein